MKNKIVMAFLAVSFAGAMAQASGHGVGNGGDGLRLDGQLYVLDLVEAGAEETPFFDQRFAPRPEFTERLQRAVGHLRGLNVEKLSQKLNEISGAVSPYFARVVLQSIERHNWVIVSQSLVDISDEDSVLEYAAGQLVQLAIRRDSMIRIGRTTWSALNEDQKIALITHEAIYGITPLVRVMLSPATETAEATYGQIQLSPHARNINGMLYTPYSRTSLTALLENYGFRSDPDVVELPGGRLHSGIIAGENLFNQYLESICSPTIAGYVILPTPYSRIKWVTLENQRIVLQHTSSRQTQLTLNSGYPVSESGLSSIRENVYVLPILFGEIAQFRPDGFSSESCKANPRARAFLEEKIREYNATFDRLVEFPQSSGGQL